MPTSQVQRLTLLGAAFAAFLMVLIGYVFLIGPQRSQTGSVNAQRVGTQQANTALLVRISGLQQESKNLATYQAEVTQARLAIPSTSGLPDFLRTLQAIGNATLASVSSLTVGPPSDLSTPPGGFTTPAPGKPAAARAGLRVYALPITASVTGTTDQLDQFLTQLQSVQPRAVLITQITEGSGAATGQARDATTLQLTMQAFVAPTSAAEQAQLSAAAGK